MVDFAERMYKLCWQLNKAKLLCDARAMTNSLRLCRRPVVVSRGRTICLISQAGGIQKKKNIHAQKKKKIFFFYLLIVLDDRVDQRSDNRDVYPHKVCQSVHIVAAEDHPDVRRQDVLEAPDHGCRQCRVYMCAPVRREIEDKAEDAGQSKLEGPQKRRVRSNRQVVCSLPGRETNSCPTAGN